MSTPQDPRTTPLQDDEAALARVLRALPAGEPPAALDAAILKAATDAISSPVSAKRPRRLPTWALGTAAAAVLAIGIGTQLRPPMPAERAAIPAEPQLQALPAPPPEAGLVLPSAADAAIPADVAAPAEDEAREPAPAALRVGPVAAPDAPAPVVEFAPPPPPPPPPAPAPTPMSAPPAVLQEQAASQEQAAALAQAREDEARDRAQDALERREAEAADAAGREAAERTLRAAPAPAASGANDANAGALPQAKAARPAAPPPPAAAAPAPAPEPASATAPAAAPRPPVADDVTLAPADWLDRIRDRRDDGDVAGARASLVLFQRAHPGVAIPDDLAGLHE